MPAQEPQPQVTVRLATAEDREALEANETTKTTGLTARYLEMQDEGDFYVVVGLLDDEIRGRVILDCRHSNELAPEMKLLWVVPDARRQGLGVALTSYLEKLAAELGHDAIFLGVTPDNPAAIPLYISLDYTPTGAHRSAVNLSVIDGENGGTDEPTEAIYRKSLKLR